MEGRSADKTAVRHEFERLLPMAIGRSSSQSWLSAVWSTGSTTTVSHSGSGSVPVGGNQIKQSCLVASWNKRAVYLRGSQHKEPHDLRTTNRLLHNQNTEIQADITHQHTKQSLNSEVDCAFIEFVVDTDHQNRCNTGLLKTSDHSAAFHGTCMCRPLEWAKSCCISAPTELL